MLNEGSTETHDHTMRASELDDNDRLDIAALGGDRENVEITVQLAGLRAR